MIDPVCDHLAAPGGLLPQPVVQAATDVLAGNAEQVPSDSCSRLSSAGRTNRNAGGLALVRHSSCTSTCAETGRPCRGLTL